MAGVCHGRRVVKKDIEDTVMANKALAKRQKMTIRTEPSQQPLKSRNVIVTGAKRKALAAASTKHASGLSLHARLFSKLPGQSGDEK